jgi:hypothetical protein
MTRLPPRQPPPEHSAKALLISKRDPGVGESSSVECRSSLRGCACPAGVSRFQDIRDGAWFTRLDIGQFAEAIRYRLSPRRIPAWRGETIDLRRTIRRNLSRGGEPIELRRKHRPERPVKLVVMLDASGSMEVYSRYFINFVRGLIGRWLHADVFLF